MICDEILKAIHGDLSDIADPEGFANHLSSCEKCWREFESVHNPAGIIKEFIKPGRSYEEKMSVFLETIKGFEEKGEQYLIDRDVQALLIKAEALQKEGKLEEAIKCLEEALELRPGDEEIEEKIKGLELRKKTKVFVDGKEADFDIVDNKIKVVLLREPQIEEKDIKALIDGQEYFDESFSCSDDYFIDLAAETEGNEVIEDRAPIILSDKVDHQGIRYKVEFDFKQKVSILYIYLPNLD